MSHLKFYWLLVLLVGLGPFSQAQKRQPPHIVFIIADDIGWEDFGCYGNPGVRTPHIDQLAHGGMRFSRAFLTASSCSPSRCSIIAGRYPHNTGAAELHTPLPASQIPFPLVLQEAGYYTVQSGKSHFGSDALRAFDHAYEMEGAGNGGEERWVRCLQERPRDQPFFAWFAAIDAHRGWGADDFGLPHDASEVVVPPYLVDDAATRRDLASYYNEIGRFDHYVGEVVRELRRQEILDHTVIVVMSDNGMPFPRAKTRVYDSGMQTPLIIHWPEGIEQAGSVCHRLVSAVDLAPTFLDLAGIDIPDYLQGRSFTHLFKHPEAGFRQYIYSEHNWHDYEAHERMIRSENFLYLVNARPNLANGGPADSKRSPAQASLDRLNHMGQLTAAQTDVFVTPRPFEELFDVRKDPQQLVNLASVPAYADTLRSYRSALQTWMQTTRDEVPDQLTQDGFDRQTGELLPHVPAFNQVTRGTMPGTNSGALTARGTPGFKN